MINTRLSDVIDGLDHPLIGKPCLYEGKPAIPYGANRLSEDDETPVAGCKRQSSLVIAYYNENHPVEGVHVKVKALSGISENDLVPLDPSSKLAQTVYKTILSWLVDNRSGTFRDRQKKGLG